MYALMLTASNSDHDPSVCYVKEIILDSHCSDLINNSVLS